MKTITNFIGLLVGFICGMSGIGITLSDTNLCGSVGMGIVLIVAGVVLFVMNSVVLLTNQD